jgi:hypothetical protein
VGQAERQQHHGVFVDQFPVLHRIRKACLKLALARKKIKFSSYIRKSRMEQLQSHL